MLLMPAPPLSLTGESPEVNLEWLTTQDTHPLRWRGVFIHTFLRKSAEFHTPKWNTPNSGASLSGEVSLSCLIPDPPSNLRNSPMRTSSTNQHRCYAMLALSFAGTALLLLPACQKSRMMASHSMPRHQIYGSAGLSTSSRIILDGEYNTESYDYIEETGFQDPKVNPLSTFAADVDTASYSNVRRLLTDGIWPDPGAVRLEEMVNYFVYDYYIPESRSRPFSAQIEITDCPWNVGHRLASIGIKAWDVDLEDRPPANLVFVIDISGSMNYPAKLPLLRRGLSMLARDVRADDHIGIVVYAGNASVKLRSTRGAKRNQILDAINSLEAHGSTNGEGGLDLAYEMAEDNFIRGGINRVILATDGDFNIGTTSDSQLIPLIEEKAATGVDLTVLGFGTGNLKDSKLEKLADHGNGNYAYIDSINEARRVLIDRMGSTLFTVAKDVKLQVEFNPAEVAGYRLLGYENRLMSNRDFYDEEKDAGEIGAGHTVTAIYEIIPTGSHDSLRKMRDLKYQKNLKSKKSNRIHDEFLTVYIRYKDAKGRPADEISFVAHDRDFVIDECSADLRFAAAVAEFSLLLRDSEFKHRASFEQVIQLARSARGHDPNGERAEFIQLVRTAEALQPSRTAYRH